MRPATPSRHQPAAPFECALPGPCTHDDFLGTAHNGRKSKRQFGRLSGIGTPEAKG